MPLKGNAFIALWQSVPPEIEAEFRLWHAREHLPDFMKDDGLISARRYADGEGSLSRYFIFYEAQDQAALEARKPRPTVWSERIRPQLRDRRRHVCKVLGSAGGGLGGAAATLLFPLSGDQPEKEAAAVVASLIELQCITAAHLGQVIDGEGIPMGLLILESFSRHQLAGEMPKIALALQEQGAGLAQPIWSHYQLVQTIRKDELDDIKPLTRPPSIDP